MQCVVVYEQKYFEILFVFYCEKQMILVSMFDGSSASLYCLGLLLCSSELDFKEVYDWMVRNFANFCDVPNV